MTAAPQQKAPVGGIAGWLSAKEAAAYIGRSTDKLDQLRAAGKVRAHPIRTPSNRIHAYRYEPASLDALLYREATHEERGWT